MNEMRGLLQAESRIDLNRADFGYTPDIIASQIQQHQMLGALFFISQQLGANGFVFGQRRAAFAGACNRADIDLAVFHPDQHFRAGPDNGEVAHVQKE